MNAFGCHNCGKDKEEIPSKAYLRCSACHAGIYCSKECQKAAWKDHKAWCKHVVFVKREAFDREGRLSVSQAHPRLAAARARMAADPSDTGAPGVLMAARAAERFMKTLRDDLVPAHGEEGVWGFVWQDPRSQPYQRLLRAWQMAEKGGDLTAMRLFEALVRPGVSASEALTQLLTQEVRMICTEEDVPDPIAMAVERYKAMVDGVKVRSSWDDIQRRHPGMSSIV